MAVPYLQIDNLTKSFGDLVLFENISFGIAEGQRVGLIAKNGSGKTTLLNIIAGKEGYDSGNIVFRRDLRVDYLEQDPQYPEELTVLEACFHHGNSTVELIKEYERCMETEGHPGLENLLARMDQEKAWEYEQKAKQILSQLKIRNFDQKVKQLSGGQLKRVALANALPQGKIERFHGTMKRELLNHNLFENLEYADKALQEWRIKYNCLRPHEAIGNKCPADIYTHSERIFADKVEPFEYESGFKVIKVNSWGYVRFQNFQLYLSETFIGDYVQFRPNPNNDSFLVCYRNFVIAEYDALSGERIHRKISRL